MNEAMTVEELIQEMEFTQHFLISLCAILAIAWLTTRILIELREHLIWSRIRKLEKEKLEKEKLDRG